MSVTTPIFMSAGAAGDAAAVDAGHGTAAGGAELAPVLAPALPDGALVAVVPPHALRTSVSPTSAGITRVRRCIWVLLRIASAHPLMFRWVPLDRWTCPGRRAVAGAHRKRWRRAESKGNARVARSLVGRRLGCARQG